MESPAVVFTLLASCFFANIASAQTIFSDGFEGEDKPKFPPTISEIANTSTDEDTATGEIGFTVDDEKDLNLLQVTGASSDQGLVPDGNITISGAGANYSVNILPALNQNGGPVTITITVKDGDNLSAFESFELTVTPVNDPPLVSNPDPFDSIGNVGIQIPDGPSDLLAGVTDPDGDTLIVGAVISSSANGGFVQTFADGSFTYLPTAGFTGGDSFDFTVDDQSGTGNSTAPGTVSITVSGMIWFVDASVGFSGDGRLTSPFKDVGAFVTAPDAVGDGIFFDQGSYSAGLELLADQVVLGDGISGTLQGALGLTLPPYSLTLPVPSGTNPAITGTGHGMVLAAGNTIRGLTFGATTGYGIKGSNAGKLTINETSINSTGGGLDIGSGTLAVQLGELSASATGMEGIKLDGVTGELAISDGTISVSGAPAVDITGSGGGVALDVVLTSIRSESSPDHGLRLSFTTGSFTITGDKGNVQNGSGGTILNPASHGVRLESTENISLNHLNVQNSGGHGISGQQVTNFTLQQSQITDNGNAANESGIQFGANLLGTATIANSTISGSYHHNIEIGNDSGVLSPLTIDNVLIASNHATFGMDGLSIRAQVTASVTASVSNSTFTANHESAIKVDSEDSARADVSVSGSTFSGGTSGVSLASSQSSNILFDIGGAGSNSFDDISPSAGGQGIKLRVVADSTADNGLDGRILNNRISNTAQAIALDLRGLGKLVTDISNNTAGNGITFEALEGRLGDTADASVADLTVTNNTFSASTDPFPADTFVLDYWDRSTVCLNIRNNTVTRAAVARAFDIRKSDAGATQPRVEYMGFECGDPCADAKTLIEAANTVLPSHNSAIDPMAFVAPGTCLLPTP